MAPPTSSPAPPWPPLAGEETAYALDSKGALASSFRRFDRWWNDARTNPEYTRFGWDESGATAVLGLVTGGSLLIGNAGGRARGGHGRPDQGTSRQAPQQGPDPAPRLTRCRYLGHVRLQATAPPC